MNDLPTLLVANKKIVQADVVESAGEHLLGAGEEVLPEGPRPPHLVFPEAAIAIRECPGIPPSPWECRMGRIEPLLVDAVAPLVKDAEEALIEFARW